LLETFLLIANGVEPQQLPPAISAALISAKEWCYPMKPGAHDQQVPRYFCLLQDVQRYHRLHTEHPRRHEHATASCDLLVLTDPDTRKLHVNPELPVPKDRDRYKD
jgi:hypothetical protein